MKDATLVKLPMNAPKWNLKDFYQSHFDPKIMEELHNVSLRLPLFPPLWKGQLAKKPESEILEAIETYEQYQEIFHRILSYAYLVFAEDMEDPKRAQFFQDMKERITDLSKHLLFFPLELNQLPDLFFDRWLKNKKSPLHKYGPWLRQLRNQKPHQLSTEMETVLLDKDIPARSNWIRLYDETMAGLRFSIDGETYAISDILNFLSDDDPMKREKAAKALARELEKKASLLTLITNTLAKDKEANDRVRNYPTITADRHLENHVEEDVVNALVAAVKDAYPALSHRYYKLKTKWMGTEKIPYWDRNAPLPGKAEKVIPWKKAKHMVLNAYGKFSPEMAEIGEMFFAKNWIDAEPRPGKDSGAFSHPTVPSVHPYILMNYHGKIRDVMTLAHELGHGIHQWLSKDHGFLQADTPLTFAETASVFGEMLTFQSLLNEEEDPAQKKVLIAGKVEDMLNTVIRQIAFFDFEYQLHTRRKNKELSTEDINDLWMRTQKDSLGPAVELSPDYQHSWGYISHFIHAPFYVYSYAFGDCLVNSLYALYTKGTIPNFEKKYQDLLRAGGTKHHFELLKPFGLNLQTPSFWHQGLSMIEGFIDQVDS
jgi:oligoendopeptidase F